MENWKITASREILNPNMNTKNTMSARFHTQTKLTIIFKFPNFSGTMLDSLISNTDRSKISMATELKIQGCSNINLPN